MGWTYPHGVNRQELIAQRVKSWERDTCEMLVKTECLKHCFRGGQFSGVLWTVWKRTFTKDGEEVQPEERFIGCDLLRCYGGEWGYKDMEESMGPFYYSCPLLYLELVPIERFGGNARWREEVKEHHRHRAEKRRRKAIIV